MVLFNCSLHKLVTARQQDKENVIALEKKLTEERKWKAQFEQQLLAEKKAKKELETVTAVTSTKYGHFQ